MMRKIVQIATTAPAVGETLLRSRKIEPVLFALCDDATVWAMALNTDSGGERVFQGWERVPEIPQD